MAVAGVKIAFDFPELEQLRKDLAALGNKRANALLLGEALEKAVNPALIRLREVTPDGPTGNLKRAVSSKVKTYPKDGGAVALDGSPVATLPAPSTTTLDRREWPTQTVHQPRGQVEVQPTYYRLYEGNAADPRANGSYPTVATALATGGGRPTAVQDMAAAPLVGIFWLAITPGQVIVLPPWTVRRQPEGEGVEWLPADPVMPTPTPPDDAGAQTAPSRPEP
jgi:hypothetical protein